MGRGCVGGGGGCFGGGGVVGWTVGLGEVGVLVNEGRGIWIPWGHGVGGIWLGVFWSSKSMLLESLEFLGVSGGLKGVFCRALNKL